jgi:hypothetical protein
VLLRITTVLIWGGNSITAIFGDADRGDDAQLAIGRASVYRLLGKGAAVVSANGGVDAN